MRTRGTGTGLPLPYLWHIVSICLLSAACTQPRAGQADTPVPTDSTGIHAALDSVRGHLAEGDIDAAETIAHRALAVASRVGAVDPWASAIAALGNIMQRRELLDSAAAYYHALIQLARDHDRPGIEASARLNLGTVLELQGEHTSALEQQLAALALKEQVGDSIGMARVFNNLGMLYAVTEDTLQALKAFQRAALLHDRTPNPDRSMGDSISWHRSLMNLAVMYMDLGRYDTALVLLQRSELVCPAPMLQRQGAALIANLALAHEGLGRPDSARVHYGQALALARSQQDVRALGEVRLYLADLLVRNGQVHEGLFHLDSALRSVRSIGDRGTEEQLLLAQAEAFAHAGRYRDAYHSQKAHSSLADSLMNAGKDAVMRELHVRYDVERKEHENDRLRAAGALARADARNLQWAVAAALLLALGTGMVAWLLVQRTRERAQRREADLLQQALRAQMDPHFLFNSLNTIPGLYASTDARTATAYVGHLSNLLRMILESSRELQVPLQQELELIRHYLYVSESRHPGLFAHTITVAPQLDTEAVSIPPMLLQPLVENAVQHGLVPKRGGGKLLITVGTDAGRLICKVRDNGIGRAASAERWDRSRNPSRGMAITSERLRQFNRGGTVEQALEVADLHDANGKPTGTEVTVSITLHHPWSQHHGS